MMVRSERDAGYVKLGINGTSIEPSNLRICTPFLNTRWSTHPENSSGRFAACSSLAYISRGERNDPLSRVKNLEFIVLIPRVHNFLKTALLSSTKTNTVFLDLTNSSHWPCPLCSFMFPDFTSWSSFLERLNLIWFFTRFSPLRRGSSWVWRVWRNLGFWLRFWG